MSTLTNFRLVFAVQAVGEIVIEGVAASPGGGAGAPLSAGIVTYPHPAVTQADDLFGYPHGALRGQLLEVLMPASHRRAHVARTRGERRHASWT